MNENVRSKRLAKELGLLNVYAVATGATLSAGFFLLPGLAAQQAGPAIVLAYLIATIPLIPATFSIVELGTAMPRAGGVYYFLDRSLGPTVGTIGGLGTWLALLLKVAFALIGMGAYITLLLPNLDLPIKPVAIGLALVLGALNLFGSKKSGRFQVYLLAGLMAILVPFIGGGLPHIDLSHFSHFFAAGGASLFSTAGLVYISYVGVTNVASLAEEVKNPERNLPLGIFLSLATAIVVYLLGTMVMVGVVPPAKLAGDLTPVASAAQRLVGGWGVYVVSVAALIAFVSVANAGTLSASRYPLAMSRDRLLPPIFKRLWPGKTPGFGVVTTVGIVVLILALLDPTRIAKLASAFQLLMFALVCLAVIVMRESRIESYDPGYRSPLYPWMQIAGIVFPLWLIYQMGSLPSLFSLALIVGGFVWFRVYGSRRTQRRGALFHVFAHLGEIGKDASLDRELRGILKEKGLRDEDPFDEVVAHAAVIDLDRPVPFDELAQQASELLADRLPATREELAEGFLEGTRIGATPVSKGVSLPHLRLFGIDHPQMVLVRSREGIFIDVTDVHGEHSPHDRIHAIFFLVSPEEDPKMHLRVLAHIAERVDDEDFMESWLASSNQQALKEVVLREERFLSLHLSTDGKTADLIGKSLLELAMPEGALVAMIRRRSRTLVPRGNTVLEQGDRLTIIGLPADVHALQKKYK